MKKIPTIIRILILMALAFTATVGILSGPASESCPADVWISILIISKIIGITAAFILCNLYHAWVLADPVIGRFHDLFVNSVNKSRL